MSALARALGVQFAYRALGAWLIALPFADTFAAGVSAFPRGELMLYEPGAYYLLETLLRQEGALKTLTGVALWPIALWLLLSLVPLWLVLEAVRRSPRAEPRGARLRRELPSLLLLAGVTSLLRLLTLSVSLGFVLSLRSMVDSSLDERAADLVSLVPAALGVALLLAISLLQDTARSAVLAHGQHAAAAAVTALILLRANAARLVTRYVLFTTLGALALALGAALMVWRTPVALGSSAAFAVIALQQLLVLASLAARARWLSHAAGTVAADGTVRLGGEGRVTRGGEDSST
jgi:hypothetical protein